MSCAILIQCKYVFSTKVPVQSVGPATPTVIPQIVQTPNGQQIMMQQVFTQPQFQQQPQFAQIMTPNGIQQVQVNFCAFQTLIFVCFI